MNNNSISFKFIIFLVLVFAGILLGSIASILPLLAKGISLQEISNDPNIVQSMGDASSLRIALFANQFFIFLLPGVVFSFIFYKKEAFKILKLDKFPSWQNLVLGILFIFSAYPIVNFAFVLNSKIPLAEWMISNEQDVAAMLKKILTTDSTLGLITNILLVAVTPAIGEELIFRGIIQRYAKKISENGHIAVWFAAILFSLIHFQFEGFLARAVLGAVLGYAYLWTKNLWVPIFMHFINNLAPILVLLYSGEDITSNQDLEANFEYWTLIPSIIVISLIAYHYKNKSKEVDGLSV